MLVSDHFREQIIFLALVRFRDHSINKVADSAIFVIIFIMADANASFSDVDVEVNGSLEQENSTILGYA